MDNLTTTEHTLIMTHTGPKDKAMTVDYVMAFNSTNGTTYGHTSNDSSNESSDSDEKKANPGAIAAIVIILLVLVGLLAAAMVYMLRRRKARAQALSREARNGQMDISAPVPAYGGYGGGEPSDLEAGMGDQALTRSQSRNSQSSGQTFVGAASDKFGQWFGQKGANPDAAMKQGQDDRVMVIGDPDRGIGKLNGHGNLAAKRQSKANSFDEAWDKRDRRYRQSTAYEDVDLETPQAPLPGQYNHGRSLSSPNAATPLVCSDAFG
jgi:hypothetical protein